MLNGQLKAGDKVLPVTSGRVRGDRLVFRAGGIDYSGRVNADSIEGVSKGSAGTWTRVSAAKREKK